MDVGVALITLNAGITSRKARPWLQNPGWKTVVPEFLTALKDAILPVVVGMFRFLMVKGADYQEHASEWGTHWNFFTTIAMINLM